MGELRPDRVTRCAGLVRARDPRERHLRTGGSGSDATAPLSTLGAAEAAGQTFAASVGCSDAATPLSCLRALPTSKLIAGELAATWGVNTGPAVLPISPAAAWAKGRINRVPVLVGTTHDEYRFRTFVNVDLLGGGPLTPASYATRVEQENPGSAGAILAKYPASAYTLLRSCLRHRENRLALLLPRAR